MDGNSLAKWAVGIGIAILVYRMLKTDPKEEAAAAIGDLWELKNGAVNKGVELGWIKPHHIEAIARNPALLAQMVADAHRLHDAPASWYAWDDNERAAVAALAMRTTLPELAFFSDHFARTYGTPVDQFLLSFMAPSGFLNDAPELARIVQHVRYLRTQHSTT